MAVWTETEAEGNLARPLAASALSLQSRLGARANQRTLVGRGGVQDGAHEGVRGSLAVPRAIRCGNVGAARLHSALDGQRDVDVAREAIALGDEKHAGTHGPKLSESGDEAGTIHEIGSTAHALVTMPGDDGDPDSLRPSLDGSALGFRAEFLVVGGDSQVADGEKRVTLASAARLHAG